MFTEGPQYRPSYTGLATKIQIYMRQIPINHQKRTPVNQNCISKSTETTDIFTMQFLVLLSTSSLKMKKTNKQTKTHTQKHRGNLLSIEFQCTVGCPELNRYRE